MSQDRLSLTNSQLIDGLQVPAVFLPDNFRSAVRYEPGPDDLFIATYPKCGTTWVQYIVSLIYTKGKPILSPEEFFKVSPFLEMLGGSGIENMHRPGAIKTHLPFDRVPWSSNAKYIYVARNPKDCCVSYFYHNSEHDFEGNFDEFFELFMTGDVHFGDYFDNLLGWYEHRNDPNILFITYEQLKEDLDATIMKIASFIDDHLYAEAIRKSPQLLEDIKRYSDISFMRDTFNKANDRMAAMTEDEVKRSDLPEGMKHSLAKHNVLKKKKPSNFIRKGIIGDWRNHFSKEQSRRLEKKFFERTKETDIHTLLWKNYL